MKEIKRVVIPIYRSEASAMAVEQGSHIAKLLSLDVSLISVDDSRKFITSVALENKLRKEHETILDRYKKVLEMKNLNVQSEIIVGDTAADEIISYVNDDDLIVMASHSKKGKDGFMFGSVSEKVLRKANCHTMVVKPKIPRERKI